MSEPHEWTPEWLEIAHRDYGGFAAIADAINAALAAEREKVCALERITSATGREATLMNALETIVVHHEATAEIHDIAADALAKVKEDK